MPRPRSRQGAVLRQKVLNFNTQLDDKKDVAEVDSTVFLSLIKEFEEQVELLKNQDGVDGVLQSGQALKTITDIGFRRAQHAIADVPMRLDDLTPLLRHFFSGDGNEVDFKLITRIFAPFDRSAPRAGYINHVQGTLGSRSAQMSTEALGRQVRSRQRAQNTSDRVADEGRGTFSVELAHVQDVDARKAEIRRAALYSHLRKIQEEHSTCFDVSDESVANLQFLQGNCNSGKCPLYYLKCSDGEVRKLLCLTSTLVDPWSYSHTIENLFDFSFWVKDGLAGIYSPHFSVADLLQSASEASSQARFTVSFANRPFLCAHDPSELLQLVKNKKRGRDGTVGDNVNTQLDGYSTERRAKSGSSFLLQMDQQTWRNMVSCFALKSPRLPHARMSDCAGCPPDYVHFDEEGQVE